jgi:hypothetical protein
MMSWLMERGEDLTRQVPRLALVYLIHSPNPRKPQLPGIRTYRQVFRMLLCNESLDVNGDIKMICNVRADLTAPRL